MTPNTAVQSTEGVSLIQRKRMTPSQDPSHLLLLVHLSELYPKGKRNTQVLTDPVNVHIRV